MAQTISKTRIKNRLYKAISPMISCLYRDDDWSAVNELISTMRGVLDSFGSALSLVVSVNDGGYRENAGARWKEYCLSVEEDGKVILSGILNAHAAGKEDAPFCRYDMTVVLW